MIRTLQPFLLLIALTTPIAAQTIASPYRHIEHGQGAGAFIGTFSAATGQFDLGPKSGPLIGGRYVLEVAGPVFLEGLATYVPTTRDVVDPRREEGDRTIGEADANLFMIEVRLAFSLTGRRTWHGLSPYLFAGGGFVFDAGGESPADGVLLPEDRFDFGTSFASSFGSGVRFALSEKIMLRADGALTLWKLSTPTGFDDSSKNLGSVPEDEWVGGLGVILGASWRF